MRLESRVWLNNVAVDRSNLRWSYFLPTDLVFETFLETKGGNTFKDGDKITQWYKLTTADSPHEEMFEFSFVYGDYSSLIDTTMKQTCTKESIVGDFDIFFKDD